MNHGDAAPLTADGIGSASFLSRGARLLSKKKNHFLFFGISCLDAAVLFLPPLPDDVFLPLSVTPLSVRWSINFFIAFAIKTSTLLG